MLDVNPFEVLKIPVTASPDQIKKAYRKLAKLHHPDATGIKDSSQFRLINWAYTTLLDSAKRKEYKKETKKADPPPTNSKAPRVTWVDVHKALFKTIARQWAKKIGLTNEKIVLDLNWDLCIIVEKEQVYLTYLGVELFRLLGGGAGSQAEMHIKWAMYYAKKFAIQQNLFS